MSGKELVLAIGDNLQLQIVAGEARDTTLRPSATWLENLVLSAPVIDGHAMPINEGQSLVVR